MVKQTLSFLALATLLTVKGVWADDLIQAVASPDRPAQEKIRDEYRNPQQTLRFFDLKSDMTVVEVSPGGGWYTNILAPLLQDKGTLYAAHFYVDDKTHQYYRNSRDRFAKRIETHPPYKNIKLTSFHPTKAVEIAPAASADRVLTFRNVHNWFMRHGDEGVDNAFNAFFAALKKGGILGVVEHRLPEAADDELQETSGYMKESYVIGAALKAGFVLQQSSEVNANPADNADHPKGVWTLPPILRLQQQDRSKYLGIGESDRMTLKFIKP